MFSSMYVVGLNLLTWFLFFDFFFFWVWIKGVNKKGNKNSKELVPHKKIYNLLQKTVKSFALS